MKKLFVAAVSVAAFITSAAAQSEKFAGAMKKTLIEMDSAKTIADMQNVSNSFERIATAEKDQWLPYYYAAYAILMKNYEDKDKSHIDAEMDKADGLLASAEALSPNNSEINTLKAMNIQRRMDVDQSRFMSLGPKCTQFIKMAEKQDTTNPRALLFDAQMTYYTPPAFGGSKEKAQEMLKKALELYSTAKPQAMYPSWGKGHAQGIQQQWSK
jgi:hypothetical protein